MQCDGECILGVVTFGVYHEIHVDFDLCDACEATSFVNDSHRRSHNMLRIPYPIPRFAVATKLSKGWQRITDCEATDAPEEEVDAGVDAPAVPESSEPDPVDDAAKSADASSGETERVVEEGHTDTIAEPDNAVIADETREETVPDTEGEEAIPGAPVDSEETPSKASGEGEATPEGPEPDTEATEEPTPPPEPPKPKKCYGVCGREEVADRRFQCLQCDGMHLQQFPVSKRLMGII